jgi:replicative DNA helicase
MSVRSEAAVLGAIMLDPVCLAKVDLAAEDFTVPDHRLIYRTIQSLANRGQPFDLLTVSESLGKHEQVAARCGQLVHETGATANAAAYAEIVKESVRKTKAKKIATDLLNRIDDEGLDAVNEAIGELMKLNAARRNYDRSLQEALGGAIQLIDDANERGSAVAISTGLTDLDECLGGWHDTDLTVLGARPAMGKTAALLNFADRCGVPAGIISTEQPHEQVGLRFFAMEGRIALHKMRSANLSELEYAKLTRSLEHLNDRLVRINDKSSPDIGEVIQQARKWRFEHGIKILFVDYIQRIRHVGKSNIPRHEQIAEVTMALKELARELEIPVVALAQVNREVEKRSDKRPTMGDLKDSGAIEQEADQVLTLYRDEVYNAGSKFEGIAEIAVCKNRHGPVGVINACWQGQFLRFDDLARGGAA